MFNVLFIYYIVQLIICIMFVNGTSKSQPQEYQGFFSGPQNFYRQQQIANMDNQKWYYSSNQQPPSNSWYWTNNDMPSSAFYQNSLPNNQADQLSNWACGRSPISNRFARIMGGQDAVPHSYPWMVSLTKHSLNDLHLCGGVLITLRHVLTAAHCMEDFDGVKDLKVIAGAQYTTDKRNPASVIAITVHPQYEPETFANDLAIVTLVSPLSENDPRIGTICLPPDDIPGRIYPPRQSSGVAIGWGSTYFGGNPSTTLKQVVLPILDTNKWPCTIFVTNAEGQICAGELSGGADTCQADSGFIENNFVVFSIIYSIILGGPLMIENSDSRWEIVGITSFGKSW
jgi:hypothetical protein